MARTTTRCSPTSRRDRGASLAEYALLVGLISAVCLGALRSLGDGTGSRLSATPLSSSSTGAPGGGSGSGAGSGGGASTDGGGTDGGDSADEDAIQAAKEAEAIAAQAAKDAAAAALATTVGLDAEDTGTIYWTSKNGKSIRWETTAKLTSEWDGPVVLAVEITRTFGDGKTDSETVADIEVPAGGSADVGIDGNNVNSNRSVKDDVVQVTFRVVEVTGDDPTGESMTVAADVPAVDVMAPPIK